jgi:hypothetical protein
MRSTRRTAIACLLACTSGLTACAGMQQVQLGIPAAVAPKFFFHLEVVGKARGLMVSKHPDSLHLRTQEGDWLQYMVQQDAINLVMLPNTKNLTEEQIQARQARLRDLSQAMVAEARERASQNKAFE